MKKSNCVATLLLCAAVTPAYAAERAGKLTVDLKVSGQEHWSNTAGTDQASVKYTQHVSFSTVVKTDGDVVDFNSRDPEDYAQQQMAKAARNAQSVARAQGQAPMTQAEFQARMQKEQAACKNDMQCLMQLATKASQWTNQMMAGMPTAAPPQQGSGSYLTYFGFSKCGSKVHIDIDDSTEGSYADVQGSVPFSVKARANYDANPTELELLCNETNFVVDTVQKTFYGDGWLVQPPKGTTVWVDRGKTTQSQGDIPFRGEVIDWAAKILRKAPLTGTQKAVLPIRSSGPANIPFAVNKGEGSAQVEMSWRFE